MIALTGGKYDDDWMPEDEVCLFLGVAREFVFRHCSLHQQAPDGYTKGRHYRKSSIIAFSRRNKELVAEGQRTFQKAQREKVRDKAQMTLFSENEIEEMRTLIEQFNGMGEEMWRLWARMRNRYDRRFELT